MTQRSNEVVVMPDPLQAVGAARERFVRYGVPPAPGVVRPVIERSWQRSHSAGVDADRIRPPQQAGAGRRGVLARACADLGSRHRDLLEELASALVVTDATGVIVGYWVEDERLAQAFASFGLRLGACVAEESVGTASVGLTIRSGRSAAVRGPEHYLSAGVPGSSTSAAIRHPRDGQLMGTVSLLGPLRSASPLTRPWLEQQADELGGRLHLRAARDRATFDAYLDATRSRSSTVVCMNERTLIGSAGTNRLATSANLRALAEIASSTMASGAAASVGLTSSVDAAELTVDADPILVEGASVGATLRIRQPRTGATQAGSGRSPAESCLDGLVGASDAWNRFGSSLAAGLDAGDHVLVAGQTGTGKTSVLRRLAALTPPSAVVPGALAAHDLGAWVRRVGEQTALGTDSVYLDDLEHPSSAFGSQLVETIHALTDGQRPPRVVATIGLEPRLGAPEHDRFLSSWPGLVVRLPTLQDRVEDIGPLITALTGRIAPGRPFAAWTPEAVHAISRATATRNLKALQRVVSWVVRRGLRTVRVTDLPVAVQASATSRRLDGLELAEASAIAAAMRSAGGKKCEAAARLGISRTTLYRKLRLFGFDLADRVY